MNYWVRGQQENKAKNVICQMGPKAAIFKVFGVRHLRQVEAVEKFDYVTEIGRDRRYWVALKR